MTVPEATPALTVTAIINVLLVPLGNENDELHVSVPVAPAATPPQITPPGADTP